MKNGEPRGCLGWRQARLGRPLAGRVPSSAASGALRPVVDPRNGTSRAAVTWFVARGREGLPTPRTDLDFHSCLRSSRGAVRSPNDISCRPSHAIRIAACLLTPTQLPADRRWLLAPETSWWLAFSPAKLDSLQQSHCALRHLLRSPHHRILHYWIRPLCCRLTARNSIPGEVRRPGPAHIEVVIPVVLLQESRCSIRQFASYRRCYLFADASSGESRRSVATN